MMDVVQNQDSRPKATRTIGDPLRHRCLRALCPAAEPVSDPRILADSGLREGCNDPSQEDSWVSRHGIQCEPGDTGAATELHRPLAQQSRLAVSGRGTHDRCSD